MTTSQRLKRARSLYRAWAEGDRAAVEQLLAPEFRFFSPPDPGLDRIGYFERCWPQSGDRSHYEFVRTVESGDSVIVTYEATRPNGHRFRNTEVLTFAGDQLSQVEVYFGWDIVPPPA